MMNRQRKHVSELNNNIEKILNQLQPKSNQIEPCYFCKKDKVACNGPPCARCQNMGVSHMCVNLDSLARRSVTMRTDNEDTGKNLGAIAGDLTSLRNDVGRLSSEVHSLRQTNERLQEALSTVESWKYESSATPLSQDSNISNAGYSPSFILDLSRNPPVIVSATESFAHMLGYELSELYGLQCHTIIHPTSWNRTVNFLRQSSNYSELHQIYVHKAGVYFRAIDRHKVFMNREGKPFLDVISTRLPTPSENNNYANYRYPAIAGMESYSKPPEPTSYPHEFSSIPFSQFKDPPPEGDYQLISSNYATSPSTHSSARVVPVTEDRIPWNNSPVSSPLANFDETGSPFLQEPELYNPVFDMINESSYGKHGSSDSNVSNHKANDTSYRKTNINSSSNEFGIF